jgi:hypothetical protein
MATVVKTSNFTYELIPCRIFLPLPLLPSFDYPFSVFHSYLAQFYTLSSGKPVDFVTIITIQLQFCVFRLYVLRGRMMSSVRISSLLTLRHICC